jgi:rRNA maturation endonuclease Nob1
MHDGCSGSFGNGEQIVNKLRQMGFSSYAMPAPVEIKCTSCETVFTMQTMEDKCNNCGMTYGVTPCHATDSGSVQPAGINY